MKIQRLLGVVLTVSVLLGGLLLVTAGPAAACTCSGGSEAEHAANADAIFVGTLVGRRVDRLSREVISSADPAVWTFEVSRAYKGAVGKRQEIVTAMSGASCGLELGGPGPFLVFARHPSHDGLAKAWWGGKYQLDPGQYVADLCGGSRALADGGEPAFGRPPASSPSPVGSPSPAGSPSPTTLAVGVGVLAGGIIGFGLGLAILRARRRASAD